MDTFAETLSGRTIVKLEFGYVGPSGAFAPELGEAGVRAARLTLDDQSSVVMVAKGMEPNWLEAHV
jgi:hypothetical protein